MDTTPTKKITLILVSNSWNGKRTLKSRGIFESRDAAQAEKTRLVEASNKMDNSPDYRVLGPVQLKALQKEIKGEQDARRAKGAKKAAATRAKTPKEARFVCCPTCGAKSKKLFSEMGGLQTRKCQNGHTFEFDKWLNDRAFWAPVLTGQVIPESAIKRPVKV